MNTHGGWLVVSDGIGAAPEHYRGVERLAWPLHLTGAESRHLGIGLGKNIADKTPHNLATHYEAALDYFELSLLDWPSSELFWIESPDVGVFVSLKERPIFLGFDSADSGVLRSLITEMHSWKTRDFPELNDFGLFANRADAIACISQRLTLDLLALGLEDELTMIPLGIYKLLPRAYSKRNEGIERREPEGRGGAPEGR